MRSSPTIAALLCLAAGLALAAPAGSVTYRYALLIGNNTGAGGRVELPALTHAEREVKTLRDHLVRYAHFAPGTDRTIVLSGASKAEVEAALTTLGALAEADRQAHGGQADSLFLFFFTGHGLEGQLLMADAPLAAPDLADMLQAVGAKVTIAVFDTCYAASLHGSTLKTKGPQVVLGDNIIQRLPEDALDAEGSLWFASSGPDEVSHEDERLGGLFTHFWIEGLQKGERDGPGITLERVWHYARTRTRDYAASRGRRQNPEQYVRGFHSKEPLYFSFPRPRDARLRLAESVDGRFVVSYAGGQLIERIDKRPGESLEVELFANPAELMLLGKGGVAASRKLELKPGHTVVVHGALDTVPDGDTLWDKGLSVGSQALAATEIAPPLPVDLSLLAGYAFSATPEGALLGQHRASLAARLDLDRVILAASAEWSTDAQSHEGLSYRVQQLSGELRAGYALFQRGPYRLGLSGSFRAGHLWQTWTDELSAGDAERTGLVLGGHLVLDTLAALTRHLVLGVELRGGLASVPAAAEGFPDALWLDWSVGLFAGVRL